VQVFQYVITIMVALMVTQHALERYWSSGSQVSDFQALLFALFLGYPMFTLLLVVLSNNEIAARRFIYYRWAGVSPAASPSLYLMLLMRLLDLLSNLKCKLI
jgi:hypothetical protein